MTKYVQLDAEEAAIILKNPTDCKKIEADLTTFSKESAARRKPIDAWWDDLSSGKRGKLWESHKEGKYTLPMAMMKAGPCLDSIKKGMKAGQ